MELWKYVNSTECYLCPMSKWGYGERNYYARRNSRNLKEGVQGYLCHGRQEHERGSR